MTGISACRRPSQQPYGDELAEGFGAERGSSIVTRSLTYGEMGVTEIKVVQPFGGATTPLARRDGYMIVYHVEDLLGMEYSEDGRALPPGNVRAGGTTFHDLRRQPVVLVDRPLHTVQWFVPRTALNALAEEANVPYIDELRHEPGVGVSDDIISHMSIALLPALRLREQVSRIFVDHFTLSFAAHLASTYGGMKTGPRLFAGGLAPWQEQLAKEMLLYDLAGGTPMAAIATACGVSRGHFGRAFRRSTGLPPHAWLNKARVERAMMLLRRRDQSISEIALECGFVDQSHFTRVFQQRVGLTPGAWRRTISH